MCSLNGPALSTAQSSSAPADAVVVIAAVASSSATPAARQASAEQGIVLHQGVEAVDGHRGVEGLEGLLEHPQVHAADDLPLLFGQLGEGAAAQEDAVLVGDGT